MKEGFWMLGKLMSQPAVDEEHSKVVRQEADSGRNGRKPVTPEVTMLAQSVVGS